MKIIKYIPPSIAVLEVSMSKGDIDIISMKRSPTNFNALYGIQSGLYNNQQASLAQQQQQTAYYRHNKQL